MVEGNERPDLGVYDNARWDAVLHLRRNGPFTVGEARAVFEQIEADTWSIEEVWRLGDHASGDLARMRASTEVSVLSLTTKEGGSTATLNVSERSLSLRMHDPGLRTSSRLEELTDPLFSHPELLDIAGCDVTALAYDQVFVRAGYHYEVGGRPGVRPVSGYCSVNWLSEEQAILMDLDSLAQSGFALEEVPHGFVKIKTPNHPYFVDGELDVLHDALRPVRVRRHASVPATTSAAERVQFSSYDRRLLIPKRFDERGRYNFTSTIDALPASHPDKRYWQGFETIDERDGRLGIQPEGLPAEWERG